MKKSLSKIELPLPYKSERNIEIKDDRVRYWSITFLESSAKENNNSQNSQIKTLIETQELFMIKLKESFFYCCKVAQKNLSIESIAIVLGMAVFWEYTGGLEKLGVP